ncbi:uncharacterized protein LOC119165208 isoform X2 [Rhipicephalus microplus]|uniref:uncharacterized protein LOC119165208 isoform X2 n=1 Tax=Rhipicephalus microplus TaxID=6941 RepID=UPI003F6CA37F
MNVEDLHAVNKAHAMVLVVTPQRGDVVPAFNVSENITPLHDGGWPDELDEEFSENFLRAVTVLGYLYTFFIPLLIVLGLVGNGLSFITFFFTRLKVRASSFYLGTLALSDFGYLFLMAFVWLDKQGVKNSALHQYHGHSCHSHSALHLNRYHELYDRSCSVPVQHSAQTSANQQRTNELGRPRQPQHFERLLVVGQQQGHSHHGVRQWMHAAPAPVPRAAPDQSQSDQRVADAIPRLHRVHHAQPAQLRREDSRIRALRQQPAGAGLHIAAATLLHAPLLHQLRRQLHPVQPGEPHFPARDEAVRGHQVERHQVAVPPHGGLRLQHRCWGCGHGLAQAPPEQGGAPCGGPAPGAQENVMPSPGTRRLSPRGLRLRGPSRAMREGSHLRGTLLLLLQSKSSSDVSFNSGSRDWRIDDKVIPWSFFMDTLLSVLTYSS